ncbi:MAG: hypothetical protein ABFC77_12590 [Thermoguttaceae bacterium]
MTYYRRHFICKTLIGSLVLAMMAAGMSGCGKQGPKMMPISGSVSYRGKPLTFGIVTFQPECGDCSEGVIQPDGTFRMAMRGKGDGAVVGKNSVSISCFEGQNPAVKAERDEATGFVIMGKELIPSKYFSDETSGITIDVRPDKNEPVVLNLTD